MAAGIGRSREYGLSREPRTLFCFTYRLKPVILISLSGVFHSPLLSHPRTLLRDPVARPAPLFFPIVQAEAGACPASRMAKGGSLRCRHHRRHGPGVLQRNLGSGWRKGQSRSAVLPLCARRAHCDWAAIGTGPSRRFDLGDSRSVSY